MASSTTVPRAKNSRLEGREIRIPVPSGYIAGLEWGPSEGKPVLALHGWLDNAKSFQPLIPFLPPELHIVAIDLPGHGFSSHFGPGGNYGKLNIVTRVLQVVKYLKWEKFSLLAHSLGALVAIAFTAWFPTLVENLITIDILFPEATNLANPTDMPDVLTRLLELEEREFAQQKECTWEEGIDMIAGPRPINEENAKLLLSRSIIPGSKEGRYIFTRDHRIKMIDTPRHNYTDPKSQMEFFKRYTGTWLAIMQQDNQLTPVAVREEGELEPYVKSCKLFRVVYADGEDHYMHMENPQIVGSHICKLLRMDSKL